MSAQAAITIRHAGPSDLDALVPLFDAYRQFYQQETDLPLARRFLSERFEHSEAVVFLAESEGKALGFTLLYPSFSSVSVARIFTLNDLFVAPKARRIGVGRRLLDTAAEFARSVGAVRLSLTTQVHNGPAHALYESAGWKQQRAFDSYDLLV